MIEDRIQFGLHYCPSLLPAPLLSCPLHFLTSICVSTGDYPNWALSIVFGKPLLSNRTRKRLKQIWCWRWADMSEGELRGGWQSCGPAPWGNEKVSWKTNNNLQNSQFKTIEHQGQYWPPHVGFNSHTPVYLCVWVHQHWPHFVNRSDAEHQNTSSPLSTQTCTSCVSDSFR